jgi:Putative auto-transporter adhesin, head GIN domain
MRYAMSAAIVIGTVSLAASAGWSQTSVIQQNNVSVNHEGASVTVSGQTVSVDTSTTGRRVVGDGQRASETRPIGPVTTISVDGAFAVTVKVGPAPGLSVEADKNLLPIVKTEASNGRLEIYTDQSYSADGRIKVTVTSPNITDIMASGSNQINAEGLTGGPLSVSLNGSNNATLTGTVSALTAIMSGANHLSARQLAADSADVTVNGSGNAAVDARQQIVAEISGAGSISVYGNPRARSTQVNGAGKITFVE